MYNQAIFMQALEQLPASTLIAWFSGLIALLGAACGITVKIYQSIEKYRHTRNLMDTKNELLIKHSNDIADLFDRYEQLDKHLELLVQSLDAYINDSKADSQALFRDRIMQLYRYTKQHKTPYILEDDMENYISLFKRYTENGGNGYIHDVVDSFMHNLPLYISEKDLQQQETSYK